MDSLPIDNRTPEEREDDRQRALNANRDHVDGVAFRERLDRYDRGR